MSPVIGTVTIQNGAQNPLTFALGEPFQWVNTGNSTCYVTKSPNNWDGTSENPTPVHPGVPVNATAPSTGGSYMWSSPCCQLNAPRIGVGTHPKPPEKK